VSVTRCAAVDLGVRAVDVGLDDLSCRGVSTLTGVEVCRVDLGGWLLDLGLDGLSCPGASTVARVCRVDLDGRLVDVGLDGTSCWEASTWTAGPVGAESSMVGCSMSWDGKVALSCRTYINCVRFNARVSGGTRRLRNNLDRMNEDLVAGEYNTYDIWQRKI
jgi:hypothetical protein